MTPDLDRVVNDVARARTDVDAWHGPSSLLRDRVVSNLPPRPVRWGRTRWLVPAAALLAASVVVAAISHERPTRSRDEASRRSAGQEAAPSVPTTITRAPAPGGATAGQPPRLRQEAAARPSEVEEAWRARAVPALPAVSPLTVVVSQPDALSIPQLDVSPIVTAPLPTPFIDRQ